jgi:hypothetical protein
LERLADLGALRRVCDAVRTEGSVRFDGDEVERGRARAEFKRRRDQVLAAVYTADIPAAGFTFGEYEYTDRRLPLDFNRPFRPAEGADLLPRAEEDLEFQLPPDQAQSIVRARSAGRLKLRVAFRIATSAELPDPCVRLGGGRTLRVRIDPLAFDLLSPEGRALGHVESARYKEAIAELTPVARPRVQVAKTAEIAEPALVKALESQLLGCYKAGLAKNARLRGSLVVGVGVDKEGRVESARPEIDAIGDESVVGCTMERFKAQRFPRGRPHYSVPIYFQGTD